MSNKYLYFYIKIGSDYEFFNKIFIIFLFWIFILIGIFLFSLNINTGIYLICIGITHYISGLIFDSIPGNWKNFNINRIKYRISSGIIRVDRCNIVLNFKYLLI